MSPHRLYPRTALLVLTALNLLNYIDRSVLNAVQPLIQDEFHVSDAQIGRLTTVFLIFYTLAAPVMGPLADRYSRRLIVALGAFAWSGVTLLTAFVHSYDSLLIRHTLVGIEALVGLLGFALVTGIVFSKFARPSAGVIFSRHAVISQHDGLPCLLFRVAVSLFLCRRSNAASCSSRETMGGTLTSMPE